MNASPGDHVRSLDGVRAVAVLAVFAFHAIFAAAPLVEPALRYAVHLDVGVEIFFVLSGFLIYGPFAAAHEHGRPGPALRSYARRRCLRIFPLYWLALAVLWAAGQVTFSGTRGLLARATLTQTFLADEGGRGFEQSWTLAVEVAFYAFAPLWAALVRRAGATLRRPPVAVEAAGAALLIGAGAVAQAVVRSSEAPRAARVFPGALLALGAGMLLAAVAAARSERPRWRARVDRATERVWPWWVAALAVFLAVSRLDPAHFFLNVRLNDGRMWQGYGQAAAALLLVAPVALRPRGAGGGRRWLGSRPVAWVGVVSYGVYLWHLDLIQAVPGSWREGRGVAGAALASAAALAVTLAVAGVTYRLVERPALARGRGLGRLAALSPRRG